jgi:hypothetical protein
MTAPLHRMPDSRIPLVTAIVSGTVAVVMAGFAVSLLSIGV